MLSTILLWKCRC